MLTGWTIQGRGVFVFNPAIHDWGQKTVLGVTIPAGSPSLGQAGIKEGEQMLDFLANHPSTARSSRRRCSSGCSIRRRAERRSRDRVGLQGDGRRHQGDDPRDSQRRVAAGGADEAQAAVPLPGVVASRRRIRRSRRRTFINGQLNNLGQRSVQWDTPDGYPGQDRVLGGQHRAAVELRERRCRARTRRRPSSVDTTPYRAGSPDAAIDLIDQNFFGGEMPLVDAHRAADLPQGRHVQRRARARDDRARLSANAFQWY